MKIKVTNHLTKNQEKQVRGLIALIRRHDQLTREPFLTNMLNADPRMPAFFLAYDSDKLLGFLTVYADTVDEPELMIWVDPEYRRQGIATQLFQSFQSETKAYRLGKPSFSIEKHFLDANPELATSWHLVETGESELWMSRGRVVLDVDKRTDLTLQLADLTHLEAIALFQSQVFEEPITVTRTYAKEAIEDDNSLLYLIVKDQKVIASCTLDLSSGDQVLYGLAVLEDFQNQGIGTYMTQLILNDRIAKDDRPFQIAVEKNNLIAKHVYEKLGFVVQSEITYLK